MNIKALVVDDDDQIRNLLVKFLQVKGITGESTNNPADGLEMFKKGEFDFIVTDLEMHSDSNAGYKFICDIRKLNTTIPIILITGKMFEDVRALGLECGADHVLHKPIQLPQFVTIIEMEIAEVIVLKQPKTEDGNPS